MELKKEVISNIFFFVKAIVLNRIEAQMHIQLNISFGRFMQTNLRSRKRFR